MAGTPPRPSPPPPPPPAQENHPLHAPAAGQSPPPAGLARSPAARPFGELQSAAEPSGVAADFSFTPPPKRGAGACSPCPPPLASPTAVEQGTRELQRLLSLLGERKAQSEGLTRDLSAARRENELLWGHLQEVEGREEPLQAAVAQLSAEVERLRASEAAARQEAAASAQRLREAEKSLREAGEDLADEEGLSASQAADNAALGRRVVQEQAARQGALRQVQREALDAEAARGQVAAFQAKCAEAEAELAKLAQLLATAEERAATQRASSDAAEKRRKSFEKELAVTMDVMNAASERIQSTEVVMDGLLEDLWRQKGEIELLQAALREKDDVVGAERERNTQLEVELAAAKAQADEHVSSSAAAAARIQEVEDNAAQLAAALQQERAARVEAEAKGARLRDELAACRSTLSEQQKQLGEAEAQRWLHNQVFGWYLQYHTQYREAAGQLSELEVQAAAQQAKAEAEAASLRRELATTKDACCNLTKRLQDEELRAAAAEADAADARVHAAELCCWTTRGQLEAAAHAEQEVMALLDKF